MFLLVDDECSMQGPIDSNVLKIIDFGLSCEHKAGEMMLTTKVAGSDTPNGAETKSVIRISSTHIHGSIL